VVAVSWDFGLLIPLHGCDQGGPSISGHQVAV